METCTLAIIAAAISGALELGGLALVIAGIRSDRRKARELFGGIRVRVGAARSYAVPSGVEAVVGGPEPTTEDRVARLELEIRELSERLVGASVALTKKFDARLDEAKANVLEAVDEGDNELRSSLADVLAGGVKGRAWGAGLVGVGLLFGVAANILGSV